jgi:putative transcriptional regulator
MTMTSKGAKGAGSLPPGLVTKRWMDKNDVPGPGLPEYDAVRIRSLREKLNVSQTVLAAVLNTSVSTIRKWEVGDKKPSGPSVKLLSLLERKGLDALL